MLAALKEIPVWAWVIIPALILAAVVYVITRNKSTTIKIGLSAFILSLITTGYRIWEVYLDEHFLGGFNQYGLPGNFSRNGWGLLIDAYPLWLIPTVLFVIVAVIITLVVTQLPEAESQPVPKTESILEVETKAGLTSSDLMHQLEIQTLKRQLESAKEKIRASKHDVESNKDAHRATRFKQELTSVLTQNKEYQLQISELQKELEKSKQLLEKLMDERLERNRQTRRDKPDET